MVLLIILPVRDHVSRASRSYFRAPSRKPLKPLSASFLIPILHPKMQSALLDIGGVVIVVVALAASLLTLISGFGLGTMLLPAFALFFPLEIAVGLTAVVHLLNNMFKFGLLWRQVDMGVLLRFGVPGIMGAWLGAELLNDLGETRALYQGMLKPVSLLALVVGLLMALFALLELVPGATKWSLSPRFLVPGGLLSGFFGGLTGHQGALRSIFLLRSGLSKEAFIATGIGIALLVDFTRIPIYMSRAPKGLLQSEWPLLLFTIVAAFLGAWWGKRLIPKITLRSVQLIVGAMMLLIAIGLVGGVV